ncbi:diguanylate cyclase [Marinospirillum perlucidum]|uniref:diguanylate cyclase n=1 Tax=Marinospirillum perlucidum TaxID=1982602 RepID=UPI000DF368E6|nr:diguanylate cyclase [Marinospirillum perlucidum]
MPKQEPKDLDHFLGDLRRALKAQERYLLNVFFLLQFPEAEGGLDPGFDPQSATGFVHWLADHYTEEVRDNVFFRRLLLQQEELGRQANQLLQAARDQTLQAADYANFLRAIQRFNELGDQLRTEVTSSLIELDELTGLLNRNVMERDLGEELEHVRRSGRDFSVAMLDLDHFKAVNDNHGHTFGDCILLQLATTLEASLRPYDRIYRYGGEEFLVLLQDTPLDEAMPVLERLRAEVAATPMGDKTQKINISISLGVAAASSFSQVQDLVEAADQALYAAKESGRNRVCRASE